MKTTDTIQQEYAKSNNYDSFRDLILDVGETDIIFHVSQVQKLYAREITESDNFKIVSVSDFNGVKFNLNDIIEFSSRYKPFCIERIKINAFERRVELHGSGLFCTLNESDCKVLIK